MNKTIYHLSHIDLDGYSCQLVMAQTSHTMISYNANYGAEVMERLTEIVELIKKTKQEATILISDLNLYPEEAKWLNNEINRLNDTGWKITITLLDHHGSGKDTSVLYPWYFLDTERCATRIVYEYAQEHYELQSGGWLEAFVKVVNAVDLWHQEQVEDFEYGKVCMRLISDAKEINRVMFASEDRAYKLAMLEQAALMRFYPNANIALDEALHKIKKEFFKNEEDDTLNNLSTKHIVGGLRGLRRQYYRRTWGGQFNQRQYR